MYFEPLKAETLERLHNLVKTPFICYACVKPTCSCSGGSKTRAALLPGEQEWVEHKVGKPLPMVAPYLYEVCGDCTYLDKINCIAGNLKPWDCLAYPLCPFWDAKKSYWVPSFATNCSMPTEIPRDWLKEVWRGWSLIADVVDPNWCEWYSTIPDFDEQLLQIK